MPPDTCPFGAIVSLAAGRRTPLEALDEIVVQVPGLAWFVVYDDEEPESPLQIGLYCQGGYVFKIDLQSGAPAPSAERRAPSAERRAPSAERRAPK
jgi:hypothetical protein